MKRIARPAVFCAALLLLAAQAGACVNTFGSQLMELKGTGDAAGLAKAVGEVEREHAKAPTLKNTNDLAVAWILTNRMAEGIQLLRELEKREPGNAIVAANLGTALELTGADTEALQWIRESVRRNPNEHEGSEWVHVKILEAKLALKRDPDWLRENAIVWREGKRLPFDGRGSLRSASDLIAPISYQLEERTQFVSAPDAVVGDLYLALGDIAFSHPSPRWNAWERDGEISSNYHSALNFGTVYEKRARTRMEEADQRLEASRPARQAAARNQQEAEADALAARAQAESRREQRIDEQQRRRLLPVYVFGSLGLLLAVGLFVRWRIRRP